MLYTLNTYNVLYINYMSIKWFKKIKINESMQIIWFTLEKNILFSFPASSVYSMIGEAGYIIFPASYISFFMHLQLGQTFYCVKEMQHIKAWVFLKPIFFSIFCGNLKIIFWYLFHWKMKSNSLCFKSCLPQWLAWPKESDRSKFSWMFTG